MPAVEIAVKPDDGLVYSIRIDEQPITITDGSATVELAAGQHVVAWHTMGDPGDALGIVLKQGNRTLVEVKRSAIPSKGGPGFGFRRFAVA